jgi:DNA-binding response OmpR family regulator
LPTISPPRNVLIADRERVIADTLGKIFSAVGYDVRVAYDASSALALAESWAPDLVILDHLPDLNRLDAAKRFCAHVPHCRIIFLSSTMAEPLPVEARCLNFESFCKPVHPAVLLEAAARLLRHFRE